MIWCLDFHAPYRCHHAGACCKAGWTIPFEDGTVAAQDDTGACIFLDGRARRCAIHRARGIDALPLACRMFPRVVLHDGRGTFVSLSHFCPTAAALLFEGSGRADIVGAPAALANVGDLDGLDARHEWPPLLRPGVLMDLESYGAWERRAVVLLTGDAVAARDALARLEDVTARVIAWTPGSASLRDRVHGAFDQDRPPRMHAGSGRDTAVTRWLAARLFGAWSAYQGDGLAATMRYLRSCLQTFEEEVQRDADAREAIRRSDFRLLHRG